MKKYFIAGSMAVIMLWVGAGYGAEIIYLAGKVEVKPAQEKTWQPAKLGMKVVAGDIILTQGIDSGADIDLDDNNRGKKVLRIGESTQVVLRSSFERDKIDNVDLDYGTILSKIEKIKGGSTFEVYTLTAVAGVRGTDWEVNTKKDEEEAEFSCYKGKIYVKTFGRQGELLDRIDVAAGYTTSVKKFEPAADVAPISREKKNEWKEENREIADNVKEYEKKIAAEAVEETSSMPPAEKVKSAPPVIEDIIINGELVGEENTFYSSDLDAGKAYISANIDAAEEDTYTVYWSLDNGATWEEIGDDVDFEHKFTPQMDVEIPIILKVCNVAGACTMSDKISVIFKTDSKTESLNKFMNTLNNAYRTKQLKEVMSCFSEEEFSRYITLEEKLSDFFEAVQVNSSQIDLAGVVFRDDEAIGELRWSADVTTLDTRENLRDSGTALVRLKQAGKGWKVTFVNDIQAVMYGELSEEVLDADLPDFIITHIDVGRTPLRESESTTVTVEVENKGKSSAENIKVSVYDDNSACPDHSLIGVKSIERLEAGHSASVTVSFTGYYPYGLHKIRAVVDEENKIEESLESNNTATTQILVIQYQSFDNITEYQSFNNLVE